MPSRVNERTVFDLETSMFVPQHIMLKILMERAGLTRKQLHLETKGKINTNSTASWLSDIFKGDNRHLPMRYIVPVISAMRLTKREEEHYIAEFFKAHCEDNLQPFIKHSRQGLKIESLKYQLQLANSEKADLRAQLYYMRNAASESRIEKAEVKRLYFEIEESEESYQRSVGEFYKAQVGWRAAIFDLLELQNHDTQLFRFVSCALPDNFAEQLIQFLDQEVHFDPLNPVFSWDWVKQLPALRPRANVNASLMEIWKKDNESDWQTWLNFYRKLENASDRKELFNIRRYSTNPKKAFRQFIDTNVNKIRVKHPSLYTKIRALFERDETTVYRHYLNFYKTELSKTVDYFSFHELYFPRFGAEKLDHGALITLAAYLPCSKNEYLPSLQSVFNIFGDAEKNYGSATEYLTHNVSNANLLKELLEVARTLYETQRSLGDSESVKQRMEEFKNFKVEDFN
jgi:hypothetical protein